jgi:twitching motility two-component system response regulator PilH
MVMKKVLVCDDSAADRKNVEQVVTGAGYVVISASDGKEALEKAKAEKPDLIFMDIIMPNMDGYEACRMLANTPETKSIPVIFVTSKGQQADKVWAQMQGGKGLISKPFKSEEILGALKAA